MLFPKDAHVAVVDGTQFLLFQNIGTAQDIKLKRIDTGDISDSNKSAGIRDQHATRKMDGGAQLAELAHGAGVAEYLNDRVMAGDIAKLLIICDPDTLGEMRRHYHKELEGALMGDMAKTLTNSPVEDIIRAIDAA